MAREAETDYEHLKTINAGREAIYQKYIGLVQHDYSALVTCLILVIVLVRAADGFRFVDDNCQSFVIVVINLSFRRKLIYFHQRHFSLLVYVNTRVFITLAITSSARSTQLWCFLSVF